MRKKFIAQKLICKLKAKLERKLELKETMLLGTVLKGFPIAYSLARTCNMMYNFIPLIAHRPLHIQHHVESYFPSLDWETYFKENSSSYRNILIIDDIVDTGLTLARLKDYLLKERRASSVKICVLLDKYARRLPRLRRKLHIDYVGFEVPNRFVAGYGIDCAEHFRELPYIVVVNEKYFKKKKKRGKAK